MDKDDFLLAQIDEFREKAKQLQEMLITKESKAKELQTIVQEREVKADELQQILDERQEKVDQKPGKPFSVHVTHPSYGCAFAAQAEPS